MTKLGKIVSCVAPKFVARVIELDTLRNQIVMQKFWVRSHSDEYNSTQHLAAKEKLQNLNSQFNTQKMWFMKKL